MDANLDKVTLKSIGPPIWLPDFSSLMRFVAKLLLIVLLIWGALLLAMLMREVVQSFSSATQSVMAAASSSFGSALGMIGAKWFLDPFLTHAGHTGSCLLYTSPSPRDGLLSRMPSSA